MPLLLEPNSADTVDEESQNHEHDLQSLTWQNIEIDENKMAALMGAIEEILNCTDNLPDQIIEAAKAVSKISSGINWLQNHKEDFERIMGRASILVVVLWQSYKKSKNHSLVWPPPKLTKVVDYLVETIRRIYKLMENKFKNLAKRIFGGYPVRDHGKFKKYERRLDSVAEDLEKRPSNIKINELLLEVFDSRAQHHDDSELSEQLEPARSDSLDKEDTQRRATIHEIPADGSNSQRKASAAVKPTNRKTKSEASEKIKNKVNNDSRAQYFEELKKDEDAHRSENKGKKKKITADEDVEKGTSGQGYWPNKAGSTRTKARERLSLSQTTEDEESTGNEGPSKKKKPTMGPKQNVRRQTAPPQPSSPGISINNNGTGTMYNKDMGNVYYSTYSNVGNNNSRNYFQPRRKPTKDARDN